jgi:uncharacterized Tic20 family protein
MKQPNLGFTVAELRQEKGLTQEKLAEFCEVTTRTIQRIEAGEVEPRAFTRNSLSNVLDFDFNEDNSGRENLWLAAMHLSSAFPVVLPALLIWSGMRTQSYRIDEQGRDVLNFQISMALMMFLVVCLCIFLPVPLIMYVFKDIDTSNSPLLLLPLLPLVTIAFFTTYQGVINAFRAVAGKPIRYRLCMPFIK